MKFVGRVGDQQLIPVIFHILLKQTMQGVGISTVLGRDTSGDANERVSLSTWKRQNALLYIKSQVRELKASTKESLRWRPRCNLLLLTVCTILVKHGLQNNRRVIKILFCRVAFSLMEIDQQTPMMVPKCLQNDPGSTQQMLAKCWVLHLKSCLELSSARSYSLLATLMKLHSNSSCLETALHARWNSWKMSLSSCSSMYFGRSIPSCVFSGITTIRSMNHPIIPE